MYRRGKYNNTIVTLDSIKFRSKKEGARYCELKLLLKAGLIKELELQPKFTIAESIVWGKIKLRKITYSADFQYRQDGATVVEDVKGVETNLYKLKRLLFLNLYPQYKFIQT